MGKIEMSRKEIERITILESVMNGRLTQKKASETLKISLRQTKRLCKRYAQKGAEGLIHRNRGKPSNRQMNGEIKHQVVEIMREEKYRGFGPTLFGEILAQNFQIKVSREWIRQEMATQGLWKSKKLRKIKNHPRRERRPRRGELIQLDGSYEYWFEDRGPKCCLLVMIDDATSELMAMRFVEHETTHDYFEIMKEYINRHNCPLALYSDRHSIFKISKGELKETNIHQTQFERAMKEIGIKMIHANSPQAKGRVERANGVLQDRLIKKMRLANIRTVEEGNSFLEEYMKEHNEKFARRAQCLEDAHVEMIASNNLERILTIKQKRKVSKNLEVQYQNVVYQLDLKNCARRMFGKAIDVFESSKGEIRFEYEGKNINYSIYQQMNAQRTVIGYKELEVYSNEKKPLTAVQRYRKGIACNF